MKKTFLILQCSTLQSIVVPYNSWLTGASMSEQARRVTDWRRERRWEMVELKGCQHRRWRVSCTVTPDVDGMHIYTFESLQLEGSYIGNLLLSLEALKR